VTLAAKLMTPLSLLMTGTMKKCIDKDVLGLEAIAKQGSAAAVTSA